MLAQGVIFMETEMRSYEVLKTFKYSPDGIRIIDLKKGDTGGIKDVDIGDMIKAGYVKDVQSKKKEPPVSPQGEPEESGDPTVVDTGMLLAMGRGHIEKILRHYGFELDKRKSLKSARAEMVERVLLNQLGHGEPKAMVKFYEESFGVKLEIGNKSVNDLALEMSVILETAFSHS